MAIFFDLLTAKDGDAILVRSDTYEGPINRTIVIGNSIAIIGQNPEDTIIISTLHVQ